MSLVAGIGLGIPLYATTVFINYLESSLAFSSTVSGETVALRVATIILCAPCFALLNSYAVIDTRLLILGGFVLTSVSYVLQATATTAISGAGSFIAPVLLSGVGFAAIFSPLVFATVGAVGFEFASTTAALLKLSFTLGGTVASTILGVLLDHREAFHLSTIADAMVPARSVVSRFLGDNPHMAGQKLAALAMAQAETSAYADAALFTAAALVVFVPLALFVPVARATR